MTANLGLALMVKDEAPVIERCLDSVKDHIQTWTVIDTGSTDGTPQMVEAILHGIPGQLLLDPWIDFGANRTRLLAAAKGKSRWILTLDADETLDTVGDFPDGDAGMVRYTGPTDYAVPLLLSGELPWSYVGRTHEYVTCTLKGRGKPVPAPGWTVTHHEDGSSRAEKYERDLALLGPDAACSDPRAMFYLARTYADMGKTDEAIDWFRRRVAVGGWDEEVFVAQLQLGILTWEHQELVLAATMRPTRAEPWLYLAQIAADRENWSGARACAEHGLTIPYPYEDTLFIDRWIYEWGLLLERSAAAWHLGDIEQCRRDSMALLGYPPGVYRERVLRNLELCR